MNHTVKIATISLAFVAEGLREDLKAAGIDSTRVRTKWVNKNLPPPMNEVYVSEADKEKAIAVCEAWKAARKAPAR